LIALRGKFTASESGRIINAEPKRAKGSGKVSRSEVRGKRIRCRCV
jgi:hypothetical protein